MQLRLLRQTKGHSLKSVAAALNMTVANMSNIENGHNNVTIFQLRQLSDFYDVQISQLLVLEF